MTHHTIVYKIERIIRHVSNCDGQAIKTLSPYTVISPLARLDRFVLMKPIHLQI